MLFSHQSINLIVVFFFFVGQTEKVRCLSIDPTGEYLVSGSDDKTVRIWEIESGRNIRTLSLGNQVVYGVAWNPDPSKNIIAIAAYTKQIPNFQFFFSDFCIL